MHPEERLYRKSELLKKPVYGVMETIINDKQKTISYDLEDNLSVETKYANHLIVHTNKKAMIITSRVHPGEI